MRIRRYILVLLLVSIGGMLLFFNIQSNFLKELRIDNKILYDLQFKKEIMLNIDKSILKLQILFLKLSNNDYVNIDKIKKEIENIKKNLQILRSENIYKNEIDSELEKLSLLEKKFYKLNKSIKEKDFLSTCSKMIKNNNHMIYITNNKIKSLKQKLNEKIKFYFKIEVLFILVASLIIIFVVYILIKKIMTIYEELEYRFYYDNLTGLKKRVALEEEVKNKAGSLFLIDIDDFKTINELYGVQVGNEVLIKFGKYLSKFLKNREDNIYRISGDVFALYFSEKINVKKLAFIIREKIINNAILIPQIGDSLELDVKMGIGVGDELLEKATLALDYVKKYNLQYYVLSKKIVENRKDIEFALEWQKNIKKGLKKDKFLPFFQPIVDKDKNIIKYESLMRLEIELNGEIKYIPPFYLDVAIKSRQYYLLSKTIIKKVFEKIANNNIEVTINLNYLDIKNPEMNDFIFDLLEKYKGIGKRITFEILEDENIEDYELVKNFIKRFKTYGTKLAIDDFGSGYSNFQRVLELEPDFIKIDGTLIKNIDKDKASYVIVNSMVHYAKEFNIKVIAEYIHSKEVFEVCKKLGVDYFQGFYISKPLKDI